MKGLIIIIGLLFSLQTFACDCGYGGSFLKMAPHAQLVSLVKVTKYLSFKDIYGEKTPMSMEVEIIEIYKGNENRKTFIVWGDPGHLCRPYLDVFKEGNFYVLALYPGQPNHGHENEKMNDYHISNCGAFWLWVEMKSSIASGDIDSKNRKPGTITLNSLKARVAANSR